MPGEQGIQAQGKAAMKTCALCHGKLGLGARFRNIWNGCWWVHVRFCSVRCERIYEVKRNDAPNIAGTPSLLAAIREADCSVPGCRPNPGERLVFSAFGNAVSGLLAQSERGSFLFPFGVLRDTPPSIRHQPPAPVVKFFGQRCPNVEAG
jgi:hypothetical protein